MIQRNIKQSNTFMFKCPPLRGKPITYIQNKLIGATLFVVKQAKPNNKHNKTKTTTNNTKYRNIKQHKTNKLEA